jgi:hypothetical protein
MLAGAPGEAERAVRRGYDVLEEMGEKAYLSGHAGLLAHAAYAQARYDDSERFSDLARELTAAHDLSTESLWRGASAKMLAQRGDHPAAERLALDAVRTAERTIYHFVRTGALLDLGEVRRLAGRQGPAARAVGDALALFEHKGDIASAVRARAVLRELLLAPGTARATASRRRR